MKQEKINFKDLSKHLPFKWRVQSARYGKASCVAYIDARDAQDLLDDVVAPGNWATEYYEANGLLMCKVGIFVDGHWVWKSDTGSESNVEKDKGHASDACPLSFSTLDSEPVSDFHTQCPSTNMPTLHISSPLAS